MKILTTAFLLLSAITFGQTSKTEGDTIFNQTDKQGFKQGFWKGYYENKKIKYTGYFKDNKPVGVFKRYYDDGIIKAIMVYDQTSIKTYATLYYQNGSKAAEGNYIGNLKDSTWNYYSFYDKSLSNRENYVKGKKEGLSISYYPSGKVSQELQFNNDMKHGIWKQYYESGSLKLSATYVAGKRSGEFLVNYPDDKPEWKGYYLEDMKDGVWMHYNPDGSFDSQIEFVKGIARNAEELDKKEQEVLKINRKEKRHHS
ncbi:MAG: hypothetical protein HC905_26035 [Bacteroidales bacterium]|nr:hypothetical protein [Bacteroidales bacterium]